MTKKHKIIIVDDEPDILDIYKEIIGAQHEVEAYSDPKAFIKSLSDKNTESPSLVITDLKMPGLEGIAMIRQAQALGRHFPIILLSGHLDTKASVEAIDIGVYRLMEKPFDEAALLDAIDQLLIEHDIFMVRNEIRTVMSQIRELYSSMRLAMLPYIPEDVLSRMVVDAPMNGEQKKLSFEDLLEVMEGRLDLLLRSEKMLSELRQQKFRS